MSGFDFVKLSEDPTWKSLWESDEIQGLREKMIAQLTSETFPEARRQYIAGRLGMLEYFRRFVAQQARRQLAEEQKLNEELRRRVEEDAEPSNMVNRIRRMIPRVV